MHQFLKSNSVIFVCEFITAGGLNHAELPIKLANEGTLMRDALLRDLASLPYRIVTSLDARLKPLENCNYTLVHAEEDVWAIWKSLMQQADAVWLIAPETDGLLQKLTGLTMQLGKPVIGSAVQAVTITASKLNTFNTLHHSGISTIPTYTAQQYRQLANKSGQWVVKPEDGAGCEQTYFFNDADQLLQWLSLNDTENSVVQPYIAGQPGSVSCVMHQGSARVLSCNQQLVSIENGVFRYQGSVVNGLCKYWAGCELLAAQVAQALPDLAGYVGLDIVALAKEDNIVLIEINPRLTTSYVGLAASIGHNPAALIIDFMTKDITKENAPWPLLQKHAVRVDV